MLLKSWAIPPASTPRLSSFWVWNICSSMTRRCRSARRSAVTSSPIAWTATGGPSGSPTAVSVHSCQRIRPPGASDSTVTGGSPAIKPWMAWSNRPRSPGAWPSAKDLPRTSAAVLRTARR